MSIKNNAKKKAKSKVKKIVFLVIQPFLPFIIIILVLFFSICSIIDAVFIQEVQKQDSFMSEVELELKNKCIKKAEELNMCDNYIGNESTKELLDVNNRENEKMLQWSHLYAIMAFHNMTNNTKMDENLLNKVANSFKSTFKYEKVNMKIETTEKDKDGKETKTTKDQEVCILIESDTIMGHYKYNYEDKTSINNNITTTGKSFVGEELIGSKYERLRNYLKQKLKIREDDLDADVEIVIEAANGYYDNEENVEWLQKSTSYAEIITDGEGLVPTGMFCWPIPGYKTISSHFGMRLHPIYKVNKLHTGTDVGAPMRSKVCCYGRWYSFDCILYFRIWKYCYDKSWKWNNDIICTWF